MRRFAVLFVVTFLLVTTVPVFAGQVGIVAKQRSVIFYVGLPHYMVLEDGIPVDYVDFDVAAFVYNDRVYVPVRPLLKAAGVSDEDITCDGTKVTARVTVRGVQQKTLEISLEGPSIKMDGVGRKTYGPPVVKEGRTCLPARAIGEALYYSVQWVEPEDDKPGMVIFWAFPWEEFYQKSGRAGIDRSQLYSGIQHAREYAEKLITLADRRIDFSDEAKYRNNMYNARLAAEKIDGTVLQPGETFSFNAATGPRTRENSFRWGLGLAGPDLGSGVCRAATVLYQAARDAGLEIVERRTHVGGDVPYASHEDDAAVQWGVADLKFRNSFDFPVKIRIWSESENSLRAKIIKMFG